MSNLMHKVKDAMTGHHHSEDKGSSHDSSNVTKMDETRDTYGSSNTDNYASGGHGTGGYYDSKMPATMETGNTYGSTTTGAGDYGSAGRRNPVMGSQMGMGDTYDRTTMDTSNYASGGHSSGVTYDSKRVPTDMGSSAMNSGGYSTGFNTYGSGNNNAGPHGSKLANELDPRVDSDMDNRARDMNVGPHESKMANKLDPRVDSDLDNRGAYGGAQTTSTSQMGGYSSNYGTTGTTGTTTTGGYTPNYGATGGNNLGSYAPPAYNTRSARTDMGDTMDTRAEPELTGQGAFGGTAASGSSYNAPESGARKTSGPHSSDLLNKLDPRVHSSDYESSTAGNQRGY